MYINNSTAGSDYVMRVVGRKGLILGPYSLQPGDVATPVLLLLSVFYLMDLTYPSAYGQFLGAMQQIILSTPFDAASKKCIKLINQLRANKP
jgi:hypothetical protein